MMKSRERQSKSIAQDVAPTKLTPEKIAELKARIARINPELLSAKMTQMNADAQTSLSILNRLAAKSEK